MLLLLVTEVCFMSEKDPYEKKVANLLKAQLKLQGVTYGQLVDKLAEIGISEKEVNIRNKLARGKFSAAFMVQCFESLGVNEVRLN